MEQRIGEQTSIILNSLEQLRDEVKKNEDVVDHLRGSIEAADPGKLDRSQSRQLRRQRQVRGGRLQRDHESGKGQRGESPSGHAS